MLNKKRNFIINKNNPHDNTELVSYIINKNNNDNKNENSIPVYNTSINIKTEKNTYKLIRLNDEQFFLLGKNSVPIFEDYGHLLSLFGDKTIIYSSISRMYTALKILFGESSEYYDDYKGSFFFPFLIYFCKGEEEFGYLMDLHDTRGSVEFNMAKLIHETDKRFRRNIFHDPFEEFPRKELTDFIDYFVGFLTGFFKTIADQYDEFFFKTIESNLVIFGYKDGSFFDIRYKNEEIFREAIQKLIKRQ